MTAGDSYALAARHPTLCSDPALPPHQHCGWGPMYRFASSTTFEAREGPLPSRMVNTCQHKIDSRSRHVLVPAACLMHYCHVTLWRLQRKSESCLIHTCATECCLTLPVLLTSL